MTDVDVIIRDVTLRDGLQDEDPQATSDKVVLFEALAAAGVPEVELVSFVRPDRVPAMADAEELASRTVGDVPVRWALVLNERGAQRALASGLHHLQFVVSVSEQHNLNNAGRTVAESMSELRRVVALGEAEGAVTEVTLATSFGCPHVGAIAPAQVVAAAVEAVAAGARAIGLADTIGTAVPTEVRTLCRDIVREVPGVSIGVHLHDTRGLALANAFVALEEGVRRFDGSVGGLGGCPFAPGASGNLPLEDLVHGLEEMGVRTGIDLDRLISASRLACDLVGRPVTSHVGVAGRRFANLVPFDRS